ncbi:MAG: aldehyde dehydrogenase family protein [Cytophagales bacterium]|nr:aldehyde dehydrogenase family protein [Cytophagales bacterium]MDW8383292.1 aldehyde dehydrogenase family protein [Flammeovirgaceae bacterium]
MPIDKFFSINPYTQEIIYEHPAHTSREISLALYRAEKSFISWKTNKNRFNLLEKLASVLQQRKKALSECITLEMGKLISEAEAEVEKSIQICKYYAQHGEKFLQPENIHSARIKAQIYYQPTGCVLGIMPWNFPVWQTMRYAIPTLCAGNVTILKLAPNTFECANLLENIFREAEFPEGTFQSLRIDVEQIEQIVASPIVSGVTLTGSSRAGKAVAQLAGKYLKKTVLELGGSDGFLVDASADIALAAKVGAQSRLINAGQSCIAAKRFIVHQDVFEIFIELFIKHLTDVKIGNPLENTTTLAPLARPDLCQNIRHQFEASSCVSDVEILLRPHSEKNFFTPAVLSGKNITQTIAFKEETFGPLAVVVKASSMEEMIDLANQTIYGLGCTIFTNPEHVDKWLSRASDFQVGQISFNALLRSDWELPFGGIKQSGYGKELGIAGMREFLNLQSITF